MRNSTSTSHQTNDCNKFQAMLYFGKVSRTEERELKKHLSSHLGTGFCPTRQSVNMLSEGHSVVHYGSCEFTFEGKIRQNLLSGQRRILMKRSHYIYSVIYPADQSSLPRWLAFKWLLAETTVIQHFSLARQYLLN